MKKLFLAAIAAVSLNAFAQSYVILDNGVVITTDRSGFAYDFGHYSFPQKITLKGGRYFVEENSILATVDENGLLFRKYEVIPEKVLGRGENFFLSSEGELYTIDRKGVLTISSHPELASALAFGGNYFFVPVDEEKTLVDVFAVNQDGLQTKALDEPLMFKEIVAMGGSYFMNHRGVVHTVSADGVVSAKPEMRVGVIMKKGGNYFTDSSGTLFTVAEDGTLKVPAIPMALKTATITKLGSNYFLDLAGRFYTVDSKGDVFEKVMRDHDFRHARIISL